MASIHIDFEFTSYTPGDVARGVARLKAVAVMDAAPPPEIIVVIDVSGSMIPVLPVVKDVCEFALSRFANKASCALVSFADHAKVIKPMTWLDEDAHLEFTQCLNALTAGGQTNLGEALMVAHTLFSNTARKSVLVVTDGVPTVGDIALHDAGARPGTPLYTVAIGDHCNNGLLSHLAHQSGGMFADAAQLDGVAAATGGLFGAIFGTVLSDVTLCINAQSLSMLPCKTTAFATTVHVGPMFTSEEVHIPFVIGSPARFVTAQLYAAGKLLCTQDASVPLEQGLPQPTHHVQSQLLRADVARLLHTEPLDAAKAAVLMVQCVEDRSDVGVWLTKRLVAALESSRSLPSLRQELVRARSTSYDDGNDWLVPACMRTFSQEAQEFVAGRQPSPPDLHFDELEGPGVPPLLHRAETWAGGQ